MRKNAALARSLIINQLADGEFYSGEALGELTGLSRSAIANHIKYLGSIGLDIYSVKGRGYKLAQAIELLRADKIVSQSNSLTTDKLEVLSIIDSTNTYIKSRLQELPNGYICLAEAQTQGRGRRGRPWVSPFGSSIYMSMCWTFAGGYQSMVGLSLLVGIGINRVLMKYGLRDCKLKWPNDVYHNGKKLAGVLVEVEGQVGSDASAIIGIGINVLLPRHVQGIDQPFTDIYTALDKQIDRNLFIAELADTLHSMLREFENKGLTPFIPEWKAADLFYDKYVYLLAGKNQMHGVSKGINESGALLLECNGMITPHHGGEISVRHG
ncbi:bifunctional biotin--[acetyl-CoA-carboxylase] ligase/biotin operon repressor BirA [Glaciecola sp. MH2013]|uniref:bifunctional biotin--[acetyl-CoA-carboxylase] ligase/biotin operon repressor BirA n=1 Tax=Glaciecola sp. MH2013 TaxID=2785524 RepID=UPI00189DDA47|nr:bifunctional biotin--[acetyl-CoA-carboxylase] ligase/biotin operon repressor BirA [Glaciecola sp. MH2013]MBF7075096.1 bifunctional biotin--[acetyl-CoA-carboxylase] ligase/biotin operon repressor BirA [Glaciecola sp. MH2013]